jgi:hypothetical protein
MARIPTILIIRFFLTPIEKEYRRAGEVSTSASAVMGGWDYLYFLTWIVPQRDQRPHCPLQFLARTLQYMNSQSRLPMTISSLEKLKKVFGVFSNLIGLREFLYLM